MKELSNSKADYWRGMVSRHAASGLSYVAFAEQEGIEKHRLSYWACKFRKSEVLNQEPSVFKSEFISIAPEPEPEPVVREHSAEELVKRMELELPGGIKLRVWG